MTDRFAVVPGLAPAARLEPDAISAAQDAVIGMANAAPAVSVGLTLAALAAATSYAGGPVIIVTALPMLVIANAYRRLNLWQANCGASFEWVGRAISPYLGFMTGWLMVTGSLIGSLAGVVVLAPSVLAVFGAATTGAGPNIAIAVTVIAVMLVIAVIGIRITARTQVAMAAVEYVILVGFAVAGLAALVYYRRRVLASGLDGLTLGVLPVAAAGFLVWLVGKSLQAAPAPQLWSLGVIVAAGVAAMLAARFGLRSSFFHIPRKSDTPRH